MDFPRLPTLTAVALLVGACSTTSSRISDQQSAFDRYPPDVQQKIRAGDVGVGFTREQVTMALGKPDRVFSRQTEAGSSEVWAYRTSTPALSLGLGGFNFGGGGGVGGGVGVGTGGTEEDKVRVIFAQDRVVSIEKTAK